MAKYYFSHDVDARNSAELMKVRMKQGAEGYAIYFMLLEKLAEAEDHRLEEDYNLLSFDIRSDADRIRDVAEGYNLFRHEDGYFWSSGLDRRINAARDISEKRRMAGQAGGQKRWSQMANEKQTDSKQIAKPEQIDSHINLNIKNKNINKNPPPHQPAHAHEEGFAEEEEGNIIEDIFARFDIAYRCRFSRSGVISQTDDNRLRRYLTDKSYEKRERAYEMLKGYLEGSGTDISALRQTFETCERNGTIEPIDFDTWKSLTSLATLSKSDQKKIRDLVRSREDGVDTLMSAMKEIESANGKIKMPSRYIISKLS